MKIRTSITGFPRIGENRELKKALESYWNNKSTVTQLEETAKNLRKKNYLYQKDNRIDLVSCNDFSYYDTMLDTIVMLDAIPDRFKKISDKNDRYFAMARGCDAAVAMEMTKWFNTNYHYIVPELHENMQFKLDSSKILSEYHEAKQAGVRPKINIIGPVTFLGLSKGADEADCYDYFDKVLAVYKQLFEEISTIDDEVYVQIDEPILVKKPTDKQLKLIKTSFDTLSGISSNIKIIVATYFEHIVESIDTICSTNIWGVALDFVYGSKNIEAIRSLNGKKLIAGVVDGRNIWINDIDKSISLVKLIGGIVNKDDIIISTSCSLLHVPYTKTAENAGGVQKWLSFAYEKVVEVSLISALFHEEKLSVDQDSFYRENKVRVEERKSSPLIHNEAVSKRMRNLSKFERDEKFEKRISIQKRILNLPLLPTTTIGSFPQTDELRKLRNDYKKQIINKTTYENGIKKYIDDCVSFQESIGLDVLVHGEPERNDMVEYFAQMLDGFFFTENGWVQSYGSRCVKPPVIYGDVSRPDPMTVEWITYAQSRTKKVMKGMLTGPVTILNWSFVRDDIARSEVSRQIALSICDEIDDLQRAGIKIIQVDEAAFKEGYPVRKENVATYEKWAVANFKLAVSSAKLETQIHTHMCYSEFNEIIRTIEAMDADVITIETARSGNELLNIFKEVGYKQEVGPGVYDIHSPRVPSVSELTTQIQNITKVLPVEKLWVNPDCGLKNRKWEEVKGALTNMVKAASTVRSQLSK